VIIGASKIGRDISARKRAEDHQRALNAELDHRVKNVLAKVCAIVDQTRESSGTHADFVVGLDHRIRSLASTHDLLSPEPLVGRIVGGTRKTRVCALCHEKF
jgi:two-component sensor histidine kinase